MKLFAALSWSLFICYSVADKSFERDIFEASTHLLHHIKNNGDISEVEKFVPKRADIIIDYLQKYFNEKSPMLRQPSEEIKSLTCDACIGGVGSIIFEYKTLGVSFELIAKSLITACNIALDKDVCAGAINNYKVNIKVVSI